MARLVAAGVTLRDQVNQRWPNRDKGADGWIGDAAHQARPSDHNPDADGWVHAIDLDKDGIDADRVADELVAYARNRLPGAARLKNIVFKGRVASGTYADKFWVWRADPSLGHYDHIHVSFTAAAETDDRPFPLPVFVPQLVTPTVTWFGLKNGSARMNRLVQDELNALPGTRYSASRTSEFADTKGPLLRYRRDKRFLTVTAALKDLAAKRNRFRVP